MQRKIFILLASVCGSYFQVAAKEYLFLSHNRDNALVSYVIDPDKGSLKKHASLDLPGTGGPMSLSRDGRLLYVQGLSLIHI